MPNINTILSMKESPEPERKEKNPESQQPWQFETTAVHAGMHLDPATGAIMTPIYQTSTFTLDDIGQKKGYEYARTDNPTRSALQEALAALEGGKYALSFASGLAATDNMLRLVKPGQHVIASDDLYGGVYRLFADILVDYGLQFSFVDTADSSAVERAITPNTKLIYLETPTNPKLKLSDITQLAAVAHAHGARPDRVRCPCARRHLQRQPDVDRGRSAVARSSSRRSPHGGARGDGRAGRRRRWRARGRGRARG